LTRRGYGKKTISQDCSNSLSPSHATFGESVIMIGVICLQTVWTLRVYMRTMSLTYWSNISGNFQSVCSRINSPRLSSVSTHVSVKWCFLHVLLSSLDF